MLKEIYCMNKECKAGAIKKVLKKTEFANDVTMDEKVDLSVPSTEMLEEIGRED